VLRIPKFRLNGAIEDNEVLDFPKINNLTFNLGAGSGNLTLEDVPAARVTINDGLGTNELSEYTIRGRYYNTEMGDIVANFGRGNVRLTVEAMAANRSLRTGRVDVTLASALSSELLLQSGRGAQLQIGGELRVTSPNAANRADQLRILAKSTGGSQLSPAKINLLNGATINTGGNADQVIIRSEDDSEKVNAFRPVSIHTGDQNDQVERVNFVARSALTIDLGNSSPGGDMPFDFVGLDQSEVLGVSTIRSTGTALVVVLGKGFLPIRFRGTANFNLGAGRVVIGEDLPASRVVLDGAQVYTGSVHSRITVVYRGTVIANLARRTLRNADLWP